MGHGSATSTLNVYAHISESDLDALAELLGASSGGSKHSDFIGSSCRMRSTR